MISKSNVKFVDDVAWMVESLVQHNAFVLIFFTTMYNKTIIRFGFCDIRNNQGLSKCNQPDLPRPWLLMVIGLSGVQFGL